MRASMRFVIGLLDPTKTRADFLAAARRVRDPLPVAYGADTPKKSRAEMEAQAGCRMSRGACWRGKLAMQEEDAGGVAAAVEGFLGVREGRDHRDWKCDLRKGCWSLHFRFVPQAISSTRLLSGMHFASTLLMSTRKRLLISPSRLGTGFMTLMIYGTIARCPNN